MAWTKAKTAVIVGVSVFLAAGTTTMVATKIVASRTAAADSFYEKMWAHPTSDSMSLLNQAPPALIVRPTHYPRNGGGIWNGDGKGFMVNASVADLIGIAYGWGPVRTVYPDSMPAGNYDLMETLPRGQNQTALREEIKKQFGLVAHQEMRPTDVLLVTVNDTAALPPHHSGGGHDNIYRTGDNHTQGLHIENASLSGLAGGLEGFIGSPVIAPEGASGRHDFEFQWTTSQTGTSAVGSVLRNQLAQYGITLVPTNTLIQVLVVEKAD